MILGAVLAGGRSTRFGSDKALAEYDGVTLIQRAIDALSRCCDRVIVVGRSSAAVPTVPDWPKGGLGPLGGVAAALRFASEKGFDEVLTCGVDSLGLPVDLPAVLAPAPAYLEDQPVVGLWPANALATASFILATTGQHSMLSFAHAIRARAICLGSGPANINTPADLAAMNAGARQTGRRQLPANTRSSEA